MNARLLAALITVTASCRDDVSSEDSTPSAERAGIVNRVSTRYSYGCVRTQNDELACWNDHTDVWNTKEPGFSQSPARVLAPDVRGVVTGIASCAVFEGGLKCWGPKNESGLLGYGDVQPRGELHEPVPELAAIPFVDLGETAEISVISTSASTCAAFADGRLKCWGSNGAGGLGLGDVENRGDEPGEMGDALPFVDLGEGAFVVDVDTYWGTTCAVLDDGRLKCWGYNGDGEHGVGDRENRGDEPGEMGDALPAALLGSGERAVDVGVGDQHVCAALASGGLKCWGRNHEIDPDDIMKTPQLTGRLGYGDTRHRGLTPEEMGDALPYVDVGIGKRVVSVDASDTHTCALLSIGQVKCWGSSWNGALDRAQLFGGDGAIGDEPGEMGDALPAIDFGERRVIALALNGQSNCAALQDGAVHCWGGSHEIDYPILLP